MIEGAGGAPADLPHKLMARAHEIDLLRLELARDAAEFGRTSSPNYSGCDTPVQFLREYAYMSWHDAFQAVCVGGCLDELALSVAAVERGEIGFDHLAVMVESRLALSRSERWSQIDEERLLEQARLQTVTEFRKTCQRTRHMADPEGCLEEQLAAVESRSLVFSQGAGGCFWLKGFLDAAGGAMVLNALEPLARRTGRDDERPRDKRLADALVEFAEHGSGHPHVQVTTTLETLRQLPGAPAGDLQSLPISAKTVERLSCDCTLTRVLLGADSMVVDVGRGQRIVKGARRRALAARNVHCRWPGCTRPAAYCTPHHLVHWAKGGSSDLANQLLLCGRHHWHVHAGGWQCVRTEDGRVLTIPPLAPTDLFCRGPNSDQAA